MEHPFTAEDRAGFKRCRRRWDLGARNRRNLMPRRPDRPVDLQRAIREALAVYYFPGMWDWSRSIVLPLVVQALVTSLGEQRHGSEADDQEWDRAEALGREALESYFAWAPGLDRFSPVQVSADVIGSVPEPDEPERLLRAYRGPAQYRAEIDLLAVDADDAYWVVEHRLVASWTPDEQLILDEATVAACWAWEDTYLGMEIAGTIHNELRTTGLADRPPPDAGSSGRDRVDQHAPSGGGRPIPQHRRLYLARHDSGAAPRVRSEEAGPLRRTVIERPPVELDAMRRRIGHELREMLDPTLVVYPAPGVEHCAGCDFVAPCVSMTTGDDAEALLSQDYSSRPPPEAEGGKLGTQTWSIGRGAAPPRFGAKDQQSR